MTSSRKLHVWLIVILGAILIAVAYFLKLHDRMTDFTVFYTAGERFLHGEPLYQVSDSHYMFKYLPVSAVFFAPFALLPLEWAKLLWLYVVFGSLAAVLILSRKLCMSVKIGALPVILTFLVMAKFYVHEIDLGQANLVMTALVMLMLYALLENRDRTAGIYLALATALKPYAGIFVPLLLAKRKFRAALVAIALSLLALILPAIIYGWRGNIDLLLAWRTTAASSTPSLLTNPDNVSLFGCFAKWFGADNPTLLWTLSLVVIAATIGALVLAAKTSATSTTKVASDGKSTSLAPVIESAVLLILVPLISPQGWDYVFLTSTLGVMLLIVHRNLLPPLFRWLMYASFVVIGLSIYDLVGRDTYRKFMALSILTPLFVYLEFCLIWIRRRV